jgi:preprotein translocase subunit SecD
MKRLFGAILVCLLVGNLFTVEGADPAVDRAVQDAVKKYPPGDYPPSVAPPKPTREDSFNAERFEVRQVAESGASKQSYILNKLDGTNEALFLESDVLLDASSIKSARIADNTDGSPIVRIVLTKAGAQKFGDASQKLINKRIGFLFQGRLVAAPVIRTPIYGGELIIGNLTEKEAAEMAAKLNP